MADDGREEFVAFVTRRQLTPRQRAVLVLRFFEDHTERQTAEILGVAVGTVKSQTRVALHRIRELAPELAELVNVREGS